MKRGDSAAVAFESAVIPASHRELVTKALATAGSVDDVWLIFGGTR